MKKSFFVPALAGVFLLASCGGGDGQSSDSSTSTEASSAPAAQTVNVDIPGLDELDVSNDLVLEGNDMMQFDKNLFRVKAGEPITLTFNNVGELPKESMGHNVVVLKPGTDGTAFGGEAIKAIDNDYIPITFASAIIAHTKLLGPGETDVIEFTLDEPGVYPYLCSFPGHYGIMKGQIVAE